MGQGGEDERRAGRMKTFSGIEADARAQALFEGAPSPL